MARTVEIGLCRRCSAGHEAIGKTLSRLSAAFGDRITTAEYEFLAACYEPAVLVGSRLVRVRGGDTGDLERLVATQLGN